MSCQSDESRTGPADWGCPRPPFPIFPVVVPLIFPFGFMTMMIMRTRRRRRALEARLSEVEGKLADLTEMVSQVEGE
jgi:hypothetical protein